MALWSPLVSGTSLPGSFVSGSLALARRVGRTLGLRRLAPVAGPAPAPAAPGGPGDATPARSPAAPVAGSPLGAPSGPTVSAHPSSAAAVVHLAAVDGPPVCVVTTPGGTGAAVDVARALEEEGVAADVVAVVDAERLLASWQESRRAAAARAEAPDDHHLWAQVLGGRRPAPLLVLHEGDPLALAWLGGVAGVPTTLLEVGDPPGLVVNAALGLVA